MKEVVRKEILKLLEAGIIYPVADSEWVSPVHCVPKKGGITLSSNTGSPLGGGGSPRISTGRLCFSIGSCLRNTSSISSFLFLLPHKMIFVPLFLVDPS